ncbi:methyl-accepting chemotaxis protein [Treponema socranskii]|uniref:methyl-accepting chemotaxis protein n=1 Tax=Treponema socranskii TaxID=53419 RepID=UPI0028719A5C|nr:methyl-accepting chemotaxis protein [Treponema socranskii]MDR9858737.1 methyl-accepting chemotaxis protein [Treponema socranskii]
MATQDITVDAVLDGGLELLRILMDYCNDMTKDDAVKRENLAVIENERILQQKQEETLLNLSEISDSIGKSADGMIGTNQKTVDNLEQTLDQFTDISMQVQKIEESGRLFFNQFSQLNTEIVSIEKFIVAIQSIAMNTQLLAFNASIEAAHAGQAGKGFRVIANEIKKLSSNTDDMSRKISETINRLRSDLERLVSLNEENTKKLVTLQQSAKSSLKNIEDIKQGNGETFQSISTLVGRLKESGASISETIANINEVDRLNRLKAKAISDDQIQGLIQMNDRISFIIQLQQIFLYLKEKLAGADSRIAADSFAG